MAAIHHFVIFKYLIIDHFGRANMPHRKKKFIKIGQMLVEILHSTSFKMAAVCHFGFLKNLIF